MQLPANTIPVLVGAAIGVVCISGLSLANGWVITSSKMQTQMEEMHTSIQASVCASRAEHFLKETNSSANLEGYQAEASEMRTELATANASPLQGDEKVETRVIQACASLLNKPRA